MPKLKTHRGTAKRIKLSPTGKLMREHANKIHFNEKKGEGRKRRLENKASVKGGNARNLKRALGALK
jgi:large subunit ribosomal protein L35